jgi:hypothetical protein
MYELLTLDSTTGTTANTDSTIDPIVDKNSQTMSIKNPNNKIKYNSLKLKGSSFDYGSSFY